MVITLLLCSPLCQIVLYWQGRQTLVLQHASLAIQMMDVRWLTMQEGSGRKRLHVRGLARLERKRGKIRRDWHQWSQAQDWGQRHKERLDWCR